MATYPNAIPSFLTLQDGVDTVVAAHPNDRAVEIVAIATELGTNPKGSCADLKTRLAVSLNDNGTQKIVIGAWANVTIPTTINAGLNVASVVKNATGDFTINWTSAFADANYSAVITPRHNFQLMVDIAAQAANLMEVIFRDQTGTTLDPSAGFNIIIIR